MPLAMNEDVSQALETVLSKFPSVLPSSTSGGVASKRAMAQELVDQLFSAPPVPGVKVSYHTTTLNDQTSISIMQVETSDTSRQLGPAILHCHAGGLISGSAQMFQPYLAALVLETKVPIFSVNYRLAPECKNTTLAEDCYAGLLWLYANAARFNIDSRRIAVMGESAGGGLAASVAIMSRDRQLFPPVAKQILTGPMLDDKNIDEVKELEHLTPFWSWSDNKMAWEALLGAARGSDSVSQYAAPCRLGDMTGLPPAFIEVGQLDIFREEDMRYAQRLALANVPTELHLYPGLPHGFELLPSDLPSIVASTDNKRRAIRSL